jgi:Ca2+-transporting ATPase
MRKPCAIAVGHDGKRHAARSQVTDIDSLSGLSGFEALERLRTDGPNELPTQERQTFAHALVNGIREPMTALLLGCGAIYFFLGDSHEAAMLLAIVAFIVVITLYQER